MYAFTFTPPPVVVPVAIFTPVVPEESSIAPPACHFLLPVILASVNVILSLAVNIVFVSPGFKSDKSAFARSPVSTVSPAFNVQPLVAVETSVVVPFQSERSIVSASTAFTLNFTAPLSTATLPVATALNVMPFVASPP